MEYFCYRCLTSCLPCLPQPNRSRTKAGIASDSLICARSLATIHEETLLRVFGIVPADALGKLAAAGRHFGPNGLLYGKIGKARGLTFGESLRFAHVLEAQTLSFGWTANGWNALSMSCTSGEESLLTGDDGWCTEFGNVYATACRCYWGVEVLKLDGLLAIGVVNHRFPTNCFVGSPMSGEWSYGWELRPRGAEKLVAVSSGGPVCLLEAERTDVDLRPSGGRRVALIFHLSFERALFELYARTQDAPARPWRWTLLSSMRLGGERPPAEGQVRPAASVDIGAAVRVLAANGAR